MIINKIQKLLSLRASLVYLISDEEERVEKLVSAASAKVLGQSVPLYSWSCLTGLARGHEIVDPVTDAAQALARYLKIQDNGPLIFKDLHLFLNGNPHLIRQLKEAARILRPTRKSIFFVCPELALPHDLFPLFKIEDVPLPRFEELARIFDSCLQAHPKAESLRKSLKGDLREKIVRAATGFTGNEAMDAFRGAMAGSDSITGRTVDLVLAEKEALVRKSGVLEYFDVSQGKWEIGGLGNLKKWLQDRGRSFSPEAAARGVEPPKGILVMGISGCGKSLCVKALAAYWKLPLLRLDMGRIYDGIAGPPEEAMRKAIKTSEAVAPCVLWIDEIEAGIANQQQKAAGGSESRVLAQFLTWMQEKTAPVFVGATANEVEVLPPEILRKGRFDELFYVGLPGTQDRMEILAIHMRRRRLDPAKFDMKYLAQSTEGLNGAEMEEGVTSAVIECMAEKREVTEHDLANSLRRIVPLARTMRERIDKIEAWARDRAMKASLTTFGGSN